MGFLESTAKVGLFYALEELYCDTILQAQIDWCDRAYKRDIERCQKEKEKAAKKAEKEAAKAAKKAEKEAAKEEVKAAETTSAEATTADEVPFEEKKAEEKKDETAIVVVKDEEVAEGEASTSTPVEVSEQKLAEYVLSAQAALPNIDKNEIRLVISTMLYICKYINPVLLFNNIGPEAANMELVNTLCYSWTNIPLNPGYAHNKKLQDMFDNITDLSSIVNYVSGLEDFIESPILRTIAEKTRDMVTEADREAQIAEGVKDPDPIVPVMFINDIIKPEQTTGLTKTDKKILEKKFEGILSSVMQYQFNKLGNIYELALANNNSFIRFIIDPFTFGNGYNLMVNINNMMYPVSLEQDKDIAKKFVLIPGYTPTAEEMQRINSRLVFSSRIYMGYDLTNLQQILKKLDKEEDRMMLADRLDKILSIPWGMYLNGYNLPRTRIETFKSVNDFTLVCDNKVKVVDATTVQFPVVIKIADDKIFVQHGQNNFSFGF